MKKSTASLLIFIVLLILGGIGWYVYTTKIAPQTGTTGTDPFGGFNPLGGTGSTAVPANNQVPTTPDSPTTTTPTPTKLPLLRQLTITPVAGAMASTTASSTIVRYVDRGVGHIYEISLTSNDSQKITNTTIPRVYTTTWNRQGTAVILRYIKEGSTIISNFYADIIPPKKIVASSSPKTATSTATSTIVSTPTPVQDVVGELKGRFFPSNIIDIAVSPKGDRLFILSEEGEGSVGYLSRFTGDTRTQIFNSPLTQWNVDWNNEDSIILTTKATYAGVGFAYLIDLKKGTTEKILGPLRALTTKASTDTTQLFYTSSVDGKRFISKIFTLKDQTSQDVVFRTLPEKCVWSKKNSSIIFCAVPTDLRDTNLPDSWYQGKVSFVDTVWELDTETGEVRQLSNLLDQSGKIIDVTNPFLDPKENFLIFTNKRDLTLWSLDIQD
ncbi:MAG: hypothetical protein HZA80_00785 [Candidatus Taylorbacteria bacterium]|nr:hypothetical protein [Candidatus Taylorbacteria bacterium]